MSVVSRLSLACATLVARHACAGADAGAAAEGVDEMRSGLEGTMFWDCNGAQCDSKVLKPWQESRFVAAPQYAPMVPDEPGGSYGEQLWMTGAASDTLAKLMGKATPCCGVGEGCGHCLLVRNPSAVRWNWTAVVMKKSQCPHWSKGCEAGKMHMDFAVPGYEYISESTANVCGSDKREETYLTKEEAGACQMPGANNESGICCEAMPNATAEQRRLQEGCKVFSEWGWSTGAPDLEFRPVACPTGLVSSVAEAFGSSGVNPLERPSYNWLILGLILAVLTCVIICVAVRIVDKRATKKKLSQLEVRRRKNQQKQQRALRRDQESSALSSSEEESSSSAE